MSSRFHRSSPTVNIKQRILGSAENALVKTSIQHQGYMKVGEVLHLQGPHISLETLVSAIGLLQCRHPFLRSRLQNNPAKRDSYLMEEDDTLRLKIREIPRKRDDHLNFWRQEWREREKDTAAIGQGLAEFWLLQDPDDDRTENGPREIVFICEHSVCDGLSLSTVAHELLVALGDDDKSMFNNSLGWPVTMEAAIQGSLSIWGRLAIFSKFVFAALYWRAITARTIARIPLASVDFPWTDMAKCCYTEASYGMLNKEETQKLLEKCHRESVTVTSAVTSAILCVTSTLVSASNDPSTQLIIAIAADTRRRCVPPVHNHDLSYQVSGTMAFTMPTRDIPTTPNGMWQLAKVFGHHVKTSVDAGQTLALGMIMGKLYQKNMGPPNLAELPTCGISNWGILPFREKYGRWELVAMTPFGNMIRAAMPFTLIQTVNGVLTIGYLGCAPIIPPSTLEDLRDGTMNNLRQMIED